MSESGLSQASDDDSVSIASQADDSDGAPTVDDEVSSESADPENHPSSAPKKRRHAVDLLVKKKAIEELDAGVCIYCLIVNMFSGSKVSKTQVCKNYNVSMYNLNNRWLPKREAIFQACEDRKRGKMGKRKRVPGCGRKSKFPQFEASMFEWFKQTKVWH
jgi:hypothetical protein